MRSTLWPTALDCPVCCGFWPHCGQAVGPAAVASMGAIAMLRMRAVIDDAVSVKRRRSNSFSFSALSPRPTPTRHEWLAITSPRLVVRRTTGEYWTGRQGPRANVRPHADRAGARAEGAGNAQAIPGTDARDGGVCGS